MYVSDLTRARRGGIEVAGWMADREILVRFLPACGSSDGKEVKEVRAACPGVGSAC